jgi:AAA+ ATPase superfamily predicted ATPase
MFFGREDVFRFIKDHLEGRHEKNIIVLRGQRRTGKTSILYQLEYRLDEKYIPVLLDLQGFASTGVDRFLYWVARGIARAVTERGFALPPPKQAEFREDPYGYFQQVFLPQAWAAIGYHHLLLAFDEFEDLAARVEDGKMDKDIFPYLRSLMQHVTQLDFVFAGTHKMQQITHEYWAILFNIALFQDIGFGRAPLFCSTAGQQAG